MNILEFKKKPKNLFSNERNNNVLPPPKTMAVGIDLGTTNSVVSIYSHQDEKPTTLFYEGSNLIPSLLYFDPREQKVLVGLEAKKYLDTDPTNVIHSTKRSMGKNNSVFYSQDKIYSAEEVATHILNYISTHPTLQQEKEKNGGLWAVITVPAHFDDAARTATILAAEKAGLYILRIINEPTAAALAYSMLEETEQSKSTSSENLAIFDLGGGTFDVSIVERHDLTFNVLSSEGDVHLGGDDVDELIAEHFLKKVEPPFVARRASKESALYRKILIHAQNAKKELQVSPSVSVEDADLDGHESSLQTTLDRHEFEELVFSLLQRSLFLTERAIQSAKKSPKHISRILLVGGSTRLNLIRRMLTEYFPCIVDARLEPDIAVSWGACIQAAIILGIQVDTILVDVCTHSLGVGVVDSSESAQENVKIIARKYGLSYPLSEKEMQKKYKGTLEDFNKEVQSLLRVAPILYRNSPLPARKSEFFNTVYHNQSAVQVVVVQGEGDSVGENRLIGSFLFQLITPAPKGTRCEIQLTYDVNGMVQVFAKQLGTDNECRAHFDSRTGKVEGWSKLSSQEESAQENSESLPQSHTDSNPTPSDSNVVSLSFGKKDPHTPSTRPEEEKIPVINAIILRAKRTLAKLSPNDIDYQKILPLTQKYASLMEKAKNEDGHEDLIEALEDELLLSLEGK
jgi:molecular chaperone DnaK